MQGESSSLRERVKEPAPRTLKRKSRASGGEGHQGRKSRTRERKEGKNPEE